MMSADNYWLSCDVPGLGLIVIMAFASDDTSDLEKIKRAIQYGTYKSVKNEKELDQYTFEHYTEYGDSSVEWED